MAYQLSEINRAVKADPVAFMEECDLGYQAKISAAADRICENMKQSPVVLLSGPSGSGKTTTALKLRQELERRGIGTHAISMDDYFLGRALKNPPLAPDGAVDFEAPEMMDLKLLGAVLNAAMTGLSADEFTPELMKRIMSAAGDAAALVPVIVDFTTETLRRSRSTNMAVAGHSRLLGLPEYQDVNKAQKVLTSLDSESLSGLPAVMQNENGTKVLVGPENVASELKETSVVMTKFDIGDGLQGMIGVVGPTRMDYAKVTARLSYFAESLSKMFTKPEQPQLPAPAEEE